MDSTPRDCFSAMLCSPPISNAMEGEYEYDQKSSLSPRVFAGQGRARCRKTLVLDKALILVSFYLNSMEIMS
jgi:hypothetical protein